MQKYIVLSVSLIMLAVPAGIALAKDNGGDRPSTPPGLGLGIFQHMQSNLEFMLGRGEKDDEQNDDEQDDEDAIASSTRGRGGREDRGMRDKREDVMERFGTTTRPGMGRGATSTDDGDDDDDDSATSSKGRGRGKDELRPGLPFFLRWLFGLPGTTTVADLRAGFGASTTISTSTLPTPPITIGFFRHFFERFGNFFDRRDD